MRTNKFGIEIDKFIVILNLLTVRFDALLSNIIEFFLIGLYTIVVAKLLGLVALPAIEIIQKLFWVSFISHTLYSLVYIINDFIDYKDVKKLQDNPLSYSFYKYRPVIYFNRSTGIMIYLSCLYLLYLLNDFKVLPNIHVILGFVISLFALSVWHSLAKKLTRVPSFFFLRLIKYLIFLTVLTLLTEPCYNISFIIVTLPLTLSYTLYASHSYAKQKKLMRYRDESYVSFAIILALLSLLNGFYLSSELRYSILYIMSIMIIGYLAVAAPFFCVRTILRRFFGQENIDFNTHIKRLIYGIFLVTIIVICEIIIFDFLHYKSYTL